jgi:methyltransferase-like protein/SAM-dependent methyltransferase
MSEQNLTLAEDFNAAPYPGHPYPDTHPDNLRTRALLAGVNSPEVTRCRVLEIGCATGMNILPMAMTLPHSRFLGIDLSRVHIAAAQKTAGRIGAGNIEFRCQDMLDFPEGEGEFDYIIAHGVYSWIAANVRDMLMRICQRHLSSSGVAYISYNTHPGWRLKQPVRELMLFHTRGEIDPTRRASKAREVLNFAVQKSPGPEYYKAALAQTKRELDARGDGYLLHEQLEIENEPVYFEQFAQHASEHKLRYLGSASSDVEIAIEILPESQRQQIEAFSPDPIVREQYLDFLVCKTFRESLLCRVDAPRTGENALEAVKKMHVAGLLSETASTAPGAKVIFGSHRTQNKMPLADRGMIAVFRRLPGAWPHAVGFEELLRLAEYRQVGAEARSPEDVARMLARDILNSFRAGMVELWSRPTNFLAREQRQPKATAMARLQAADSNVGQPVTNLRHREIPNHNVMKHLLPLMDGTRTRDELCGELDRLIKSGKVKREGTAKSGAAANDAGAFLDEILRQINQVSLLMAGELE